MQPYFRTASLICLGASIAFGAVKAQAPTPMPPYGIIPTPVIETGEAALPGVDTYTTQTTPPSVTTMNNGDRVDGAELIKARREEMKKMLTYYEVGTMPPPPGNVKGEILKTSVVLNGAVHYELVRLTFGPERALHLDVAMFRPAKGKGPFPVFINPSFSATPGAEPLKLHPRPSGQGKGGGALAIPLENSKNAPPLGPPRFPQPDPEGAAARLEQVFENGYAVAMFDYQAAGEDNIARNMDGSWIYRETAFFPAYPKNDWGLLASWAWGMSRVADYLETADWADSKKLMIIGHSRIGKAVLVAGAYDERFALVAPAGSAGGGVGLHRLSGSERTGGESLDDMIRKYPNWFSPHLAQFRGHTEQLPFDQHWLVALCAPRAFITLEGLQDKICAPQAIKGSLENARYFYELMDAQDKVGASFTDRPHALAPQDWEAAMDFADKHLRGEKVERDFNAYPDPTTTASLYLKKREAMGVKKL